MTAWLLAHGVGGRRDLPISTFVAAWGAGAALVISFLLLYLLWPAPRLARAGNGQPARTLDRLAIASIAVLRVVGLTLYLTCVAALWFGSSINNIAPVTIYVLLWVGVPFASLFFGDVWQALNPFDTLARAARIPDSRAGARHDFSRWPAVAGLMGFQWLELCYHARSDIRPLAIIVTGYSAFVMLMTARHGRRWLREAETFAVLFGLIAKMAPVERRGGHVVWRAPFAGLATVAPHPVTTGVVLAVLGGTTFDGFSRIQFWEKILGTSTGWNFTFINTIGLLWITGLVAIAYVIAAYLVGTITGEDRNSAPNRYAHSLVPIAFAYAVAHYFSYVLYEGQDFFRLASDPLGKNWDIFGTADYVINFGLLSNSAIAWVKVAAVVIGHVVAVALAHDRAIEERDHNVAVRGQIPMLVAMIGYTITALILLLA